MLKVKIKRTLPGFSLNVAFDIDRETLAIIGPSGSGKTTTLLCIAGLIQPDEGYIELNGRVLLDSASGFSLVPQLRKVGFVFQNYALVPRHDRRQNIAFGIRGLDSQEIDERIDRLLNKMGLQQLGYRYPRQLSERAVSSKRVAVARKPPGLQSRMSC